jgi:hypothetical protein
LLRKGPGDVGRGKNVIARGFQSNLPTQVWQIDVEQLPFHLGTSPATHGLGIGAVRQRQTIFSRL